MTSESRDSITLKIWDRLTTVSTLEVIVQELATRAGTTEDSVKISRCGPDTFTARLTSDDSYTDPHPEVPC
jgi:hypothetical protein